MKIDRVQGMNTNLVQNSGNAPKANNSQQINNESDIKQSEKMPVAKSAEKEVKDLDNDVLEKSVEQANKTLKQYNREIVREVHEKTKTVMYTIRDSKTHEVITEFPPKKIQDMIAKMWELAGLFVDEKA